jgi:hydrophobic/amphiphilic exporter-1 (mainly G- bacteria), HAE1 family
MDIIRSAIFKPMTVVAAVLIVVVLGVVSIRTIPIQLTPDVNRPVLVILTYWGATAPTEVEREVTNRIEQQLSGIEGLEIMSSQSQLGRSRIVLEFNTGTNMDRAFMLVSNRLNAVSDLPEEAREPRIRTSTSDDVPIARFALTRTDSNARPIEQYGTFVDDVVVDRLERVPGISQISASGGSRRELQVIIHPDQVARYQLTIPKVVAALRAANASITAGAIDEGKRRYIVRTDSETASVERVRDVVISTFFDDASQRLVNVTIADVGEVAFGYKEPTSRRRFNGEPMIRLNAIRDGGANVVSTMAGLKAAMAELNQGILPRERLKLEIFYDETLYINSAISLVKQNIYVGGTLAALILLMFLRSARATLIVGIAIPVSVIGAFVAMALLGRSLNVISLAGIAFAIGMVVDAAIVVLENIYRHREMGKSPSEAALIGARQVWGAVMASALTTVGVFVPLLILDLQAGQLFRDIAVAISVSVLLSLLVAVTVIPALANRLLVNGGAQNMGARLRIPGVDFLAGGFVRLVMAFTGAVVRRRFFALMMVVGVCGTTGFATYLMLPKLDYLPDGNRNFVLGRIQPPPGFNLETTYATAERIEAAVKPYWSRVNGGETKPGDPPTISNFFFLAFRNFTLIGASSDDVSRAGELVPLIQRAVRSEPGMRGIIAQSSIFGRRIGGARVINLDISGDQLDDILSVGQRANGLLRRALPRAEGNQVRIRPGLQLAAPEVRIVPDLQRLAAAGMTARDLGQTIDTLNEGMRIAEINVGSRRMDLTLKGPDRAVTATQGIDNLPIVTGVGKVVPTSSLADIEVTMGPSAIRHLDRARTVTMRIRPAKTMPLEVAIDKVRTEIIGKLDAQGLPDGIKLRLSGAADNLTKTWEALQFNMLVAGMIVYLLMAVLFQNLLYPLVIMLSVPLATAGGVAGLAILNLFVDQPLDMLTMLGFVILVGIVVNNAILLVDQTLQHLRHGGMTPHDAILEATRDRMRPIFMSSLTSIFGLLPLVVVPGAGSELYRGLGTVVCGGLTLSALLTLTIIPPMLALMLRTSAPEKHKADGAVPEPAE